MVKIQISNITTKALYAKKDLSFIKEKEVYI